MASINQQRRLAAILAADVVGYSRMMGADEEGTLRALQSCGAVIRTAIEQHGGRVFHTAGDAFVAEFASPVAAVRSALDFQRVLAERNQDLPVDQAMRVRVGINLGDVIAENEDLFGEGVNIAARLEGIAEPGGIVISGTVYDHVRKSLDATIEALGEQSLKNIAELVAVYRVHADATSPTGPEAPETDSANSQSVVVLPFRSISGDPDNDFLAEGLTVDTITNLSRFRTLDATGIDTSLALRDRPREPKSIGKELGVRYVLDGSLRRSAERIRVTTELIDALSGQSLWAEKYDRRLDDVFAIQDEISTAVASTLDAKIEAQARDAAQRKRPEDVTAYEYVMRARVFDEEITEENHLLARQWLEKAVHLVPDYARAHAQLVTVYLDEIRLGFNQRPEAFELAEAAAIRAIELDPEDAHSHLAMASVHFARGEVGLLEAEGDRALALNPNDTHVLSMLGLAMICCGRYDRGQALMREAIRLNPLHPDWYHMVLFVPLYHEARYEQAMAEINKVDHSHLHWVHIFRSATLARLGRIDAAAASVERVRELRPDFVDRVEAEFAYWNFNDEFRSRLITGLVEAGLLPQSDSAAQRSDKQVDTRSLLGDRDETAEISASNISGEMRLPTIAVLPLDNFGAAEEDPFVDGLSEDIITELAAWRSFRVIARNSTFAYKRRSPDVRQVADELGANYILEGSVRIVNNRIRVTAQLIDAETGHHVWAEKLDRKVADIFDLQDDLTTRIAATVAPEIGKAEQQRLRKRRTDSLDALDCYQRGMSILSSEITRDAIERARALFEQAIERDPGYSQAYSALAETYHRAVFFEHAADRDAAIEHLLTAARKAIALDDADSVAHDMLGRGYLWSRQFGLSIAEAERALALAPSNASALITLGAALNFSGKPGEAVKFLARAVELNPRDPRGQFALTLLARSHLNARDPQSGVDWARRAIERRSEYPLAHLVFAACLGHLDRIDEAATALAECERLDPGFAARWSASTMYEDEADDRYFLEGLQKAGFSP